MPNQIKKTIGIDCRLAGPKHAGIGRYIENLILRLPTLAPRIQWIYFFFDQQQAQTLFPQLPLLPNNVKIILTPIRHYSIREQIQLPQIFRQAQLDLLHIPHFNAPIFYTGKTIVTIHDLLWHQHIGLDVTSLKPWQYYLKYLAYRLVTNQTIKHASHILVPTQTIKQIISHYYPQSQSKITVTPEGINQTFLQASTQKKQPLAQPSKQLIYVGSLYPHKNIQLVIKALQELPNYTLKIVGSRNIFQDRYQQLSQKLALTKRITFTGYLTDQELLNELHQSLALVQPSFSEGFGLTGIEAMAAGVPVLASNIATFKEIYQNAPIYFDPKQRSSFIQAVKQLETSQRQKIIQRGLAVAKKYDWDQMCRQTLKLYEKLIS